MTTNRYFTFTTGGLLLGIEVNRVLEVVGGLEVTPVPTAPESVVGVLNLRGRIITTVDTTQRLGLHRPHTRDDNLTVILTVGSDLVSFLIDKEGEVVDLNEQQRVEVPDTVDARFASFVTGTYPTDDGLLFTIDADKAFAIEGSGRGSQVTM